MGSETGPGHNVASGTFGMEWRRRESIPIGAGSAGRTTIPGSLSEQRDHRQYFPSSFDGAACLRRFRQNARRLPILVAGPVLADTLPSAGPLMASDPAAGGDPRSAPGSVRSPVEPGGLCCAVADLGTFRATALVQEVPSPPASLTAKEGDARRQLVWTVLSDVGSSGSSGHLRVRLPGPNWSRGGS